MRSITLTLAAAVTLLAACGCNSQRSVIHATEQPLYLPGTVRQTWAVAPVLNLSGQRPVDPILQADILYGQLQQVAGVNVIPVNRVAEVYVRLKIEQVQSEEQAAAVCQLLGCDALLIGTVSLYDPYDPPKVGASLALFRVGGQYGQQQKPIDPHALERQASLHAGAATASPPPPRAGFLQVVGMFDAANGSTLADLTRYARGRNDPAGPYKERAHLVEMDRYCGFAYHSLIGHLLGKPALQPPARQQQRQTR